MPTFLAIQNIRIFSVKIFIATDCSIRVYYKYIRLTFLEHQLPLTIGSVHANILLKVSVLVIVDPETVMAGGLCQPLN